MAPSLERRAKPLALTMGEAAGIGLEITALAWRARFDAGLPAFAILGDPDALAERARLVGIDVPIEIVPTIESAAGVFAERLPVYPIRLAVPARPGRPDPANAPATVRAIETAVAATVSGRAAGVVTNPIAKSVLAHAGFVHPGHTEFLAHLAEVHAGRRFHAVMMLASDELRVVPLTVHIPLGAVPRSITRTAIFEAVRTTWSALKHDFGIDAPRIAVAGLNPHAGEDGLLGAEEQEIIAPAVEELRSEGLSVTGPHPADTLFHAAARKRYDAALCMYHDQALVPFKTLAFDSGVNVTLGLPFVRTSPDHGTALDIAGSGRASPESLVQALKLAGAIGARRAAAIERESA
jgi:4-hydroxythreonine-4-phosphate dehydrogenase